MAGQNALLGGDVQARRRSTHVSLCQGGLTGVDKVIRIRSNATEQLLYSELGCFLDLGPEQTGAHMYRFEKVVNRAIEEVVLVVAERRGHRGELRCEVQSGERTGCHTTRREWLEAR